MTNQQCLALMATMLRCDVDARLGAAAFSDADVVDMALALFKEAGTKGLTLPYGNDYAGDMNVSIPDIVDVHEK